MRRTQLVPQSLTIIYCLGFSRAILEILFAILSMLHCTHTPLAESKTKKSTESQLAKYTKNGINRTEANTLFSKCKGMSASMLANTYEYESYVRVS